MIQSEKVITKSTVATPGQPAMTTASEREVEVVPTHRQGRMGQIQRAHAIIWFITGAVLIVVAFRFGLMLLGANADSAFAGLVYSASYPLVAPFLAVFKIQPVYGTSMFETSTLVAFLVYPLLAMGLARIITLTMAPTTVDAESSN
jgi:hypothetical protein